MGSLEDFINDFKEAKTCEYKGRKYHVRDNGAVYRCCKEDGKIHKWDEEWTLGRFDPGCGYMLIGQERVHRIVCTAFHGEPVGDRNVADHIDTNHRNNRKENLRWVTKLENTLNNPITRAKVELICGSIENFLKDPSLLYGHESENPNFKWMRAVTEEEGQRSLARWQEWAAKPKEERMPQGKGVDEWIFEEEEPIVNQSTSGRPRYAGPYSSWDEHKAAIEEENRRRYEEIYGCKDSLTPGAKQLNWKYPSEFLLCPSEGQERTLQAYINNLAIGQPLFRSQYKDGDAVFKVGFNEADNSVIVLTHNQKVQDQGYGKPWFVCRITLQDGYYVHEDLGYFYDPKGGEREFAIAMGEEWTGGEVSDDYF